MYTSAYCFSTVISAFMWHLVCHCSHCLGGKVNWHLLWAQEQTGIRPEQMAMSFTYNTTQLHTPLSNNKEIPGPAGDPFSACSLFKYMWIPVYWERERERCDRIEMLLNHQACFLSATLLTESCGWLVTHPHYKASWIHALHTRFNV